MDVDPPLQQQIRELVNALVTADYTTLCAEGWLGRLRQDDVQLCLHEYGATLVAPPPPLSTASSATPIRMGRACTWTYRCGPPRKV